MTMTLTLSIDPNSTADFEKLRAFVELFSRASEPLTANSWAESEIADWPARAAEDLMKRVGNRNRALVRVAAQFDGPFTLPDLAAQTGDDIPKIKSRWANLGRSVAKTRARFEQIRIFEELVPLANGDGYFRFTMHPGVREAVRRMS